MLLNSTHMRMTAALAAGVLLSFVAPGSAEAAASCLAGYTERPCELLPLDAVKEHVPEMAEDAKLNTGTKHFKMCGYSWPGPRKGKQKVGKMEIEYDIDDQVAIQWLRVVKAKDPLAHFKNAYRTMTPEEKQKLNQDMDKAMDEKAAAGEISKDGAKLGKGLTAGMISRLEFEEVPGLGTAAAWGGTGSRPSLKVLDADTEFELVVDVYPEEGRNREAAVALARKVLAVCR